MVKDVSTNLNHSFSVSERKNIIISGVVKIESFDSEEFLLETVQGYMNIKGENLEVVKLDTYQGNVTIKGRIDAINYINDINSSNKITCFFVSLWYFFCIYL